MSPQFEERLTAVEARVNEEATLRARMDSDLADFGVRQRSMDQMLQAVGKTQSEHTRTLGQHTKTLDQHSQLHAEHKRDFVGVNAKLDLLIDLVRGLRKD